MLLVSTTAFSPLKPIRLVLPPVILISPGGVQSTNQPIFVWRAPNVFRASRYEIQIEMPGGAIFKDSYNARKISWVGRQASITPKLVLPVGTYQWKVRYRYFRNTYSNWSEVMSFSIPDHDTMLQITPEIEFTSTPQESPELLQRATENPTEIPVVTETPIPQLPSATETDLPIPSGRGFTGRTAAEVQDH